MSREAFLQKIQLDMSSSFDIHVLPAYDKHRQTDTDTKRWLIPR